MYNVDKIMEKIYDDKFTNFNLWIEIIVNLYYQNDIIL